ncbi:MAG: aminoglycoside phosphotransferase family protein [Thermoleophilaceae bacterium]|nr:aminoglycoside phosphotransferase family protein [Thermoleophilaceae bacterium]
MSLVPDEELVRALENSLSLHHGRTTRVHTLERRESAYRSSFALEELDLELEGGERLALIFKALGEGALSDAALKVKPPFLRDPVRELEVYESLLGPARLGTATCFGTNIEPAAGRYWLFLERVAGVPLYEVGRRATWEYVARWLARAHRQLSAAPRTPSLLRYDAEFFWLWPPRALRSSRLDESVRLRLAEVASGYEAVVDRLVNLPQTVLHGEFYASNVLVDDASAPSRVCPIDWEQAGVGPGLVDLAAHAAGRWSRVDRGAIASAYREELSDAGVKAADTFERDLELCRLHLAFQWLGWADDWTPPDEHRHDWAAEAIRIADELSL